MTAPVFTRTQNGASASFSPIDASSLPPAKVLNEGAWTPVDASGAGLTFVSASGLYYRLNKLCVVSFMVGLPVTANTNPIQIGGIPAACKGHSTLWQGASPGFGSANKTFTILMPPSTQAVKLYDLNGSAYTNANFSNTSVWGTLTYITDAP
jgi:hypothetical protein